MLAVHFSNPCFVQVSQHPAHTVVLIMSLTAIIRSASLAVCQSYHCYYTPRIRSTSVGCHNCLKVCASKQGFCPSLNLEQFWFAKWVNFESCALCTKGDTCFEKSIQRIKKSIEPVLHQDLASKLSEGIIHRALGDVQPVVNHVGLLSRSAVPFFGII